MGLPGVAKLGAWHSAGLNGPTSTPNHTEPPPLIRSIRTPHLRAFVKKTGEKRKKKKEKRKGEVV